MNINKNFVGSVANFVANSVDSVANSVDSVANFVVDSVADFVVVELDLIYLKDLPRNYEIEIESKFQTRPAFANI